MERTNKNNAKWGLVIFGNFEFDFTLQTKAYILYLFGGIDINFYIDAMLLIVHQSF
jgi:hypothetical protein